MASSIVMTNGAKVVEATRVSSDGWVVIAKYHDEFVVWNVSNAGDAFTGDYCSTLTEATAIYAKRAGLVDA